MLFKILAFLAVLILIYMAFFKKRKKSNDNSKEIENFVECDECGTFVEVKEAVLKSGKYVCDECVKGGK